MEASLLLKAAARLQALNDSWGNREQIDEALLYNRKLWAIFLTSVTRRTIRFQRLSGRTSPISAYS
jgi:flagellar protein FlaF